MLSVISVQIEICSVLSCVKVCVLKVGFVTSSTGNVNKGIPSTGKLSFVRCVVCFNESTCNSTEKLCVGEMIN